MGSSFDASHPASARHTTEESERGLAWLTFPLYANVWLKTSSDWFSRLRAERSKSNLLCQLVRFLDCFLTVHRSTSDGASISINFLSQPFPE